jgi:hypothetical protein
LKVSKYDAAEGWRRSVSSTEEVLHRVEEERNILHTIKRMRVNWISHILRRDCLLKHVIEGKIEGISDGKTRNKR